MNGPTTTKIITVLVFAAGSMSVLSAHSADEILSATEIVSQCYYKNAGEDQHAFVPQRSQALAQVIVHLWPLSTRQMLINFYPEMALFHFVIRSCVL